MIPSPLEAFIGRVAAGLGIPSLLVAMIGCGATSGRLGVGPAIDSAGRVTIESTFSIGLGMPIDFKGRSQHYVQGLAFVGGSTDVDSDAKGPTVGLGADYIYWAHPRFDLRTGVYSVNRNRDEAMKERNWLGFGAHLALLPVLTKSDSDIFVPQLCIGPDIRVDQVWDTNSRLSRAQFSVPLVIELNFLAAGD